MGKATNSPTDLGTKRQCPKCAAKFYDFAASPIVCPKCSHTWKADAPVKAAKPKAKKEAPAKPKKLLRPKDEEAALLDGLELPDSEDGAEDGNIAELETLEDAMDDVESLEEVEEHGDDDGDDVDGDDADDDMFMEEMADEVLVDNLEDYVQTDDDEEEDEDDENDDDDDEDDDDDDDTPRKRKR